MFVYIRLFYIMIVKKSVMIIAITAVIFNNVLGQPVLPTEFLYRSKGTTTSRTVTVQQTTMMTMMTTVKLTCTAVTAHTAPP